MSVPPPTSKGTPPPDSPIDQTLSLILAGAGEEALRWSAAAIARDISTATALILTCRLLAAFGRTEASIEGFELGIRVAVDAGNLALAVAAAADLRGLGVDVSGHLDAIAEAFCRDSSRLTETPAPPPLPNTEPFEPLSTFLTGPALLSKATQIIHEAKARFDEGRLAPENSFIAAIPLFSALEQSDLRALIGAFTMITVPAGRAVIRQGDEGTEAYIVARGELEVRRTMAAHGSGDGAQDAPYITLAKLTTGAIFGEMALLSGAPRAASVVALRPSIVLVTNRGYLEKVVATHPNVGTELGSHCRRRMVANLLRTCPVLEGLDAGEATQFVERLQAHLFEKGAKILTRGEVHGGLHFVASGEAAAVAMDGEEPIVLASYGVGDTVGEASFLFRRPASVDVVAVHSTMTLFLPEKEWLEIFPSQPTLLMRLYLAAIENDEESRGFQASAASDAVEEAVLL